MYKSKKEVWAQTSEKPNIKIDHYIPACALGFINSHRIAKRRPHHQPLQPWFSSKSIFVSTMLFYDFWKSKMHLSYILWPCGRTGNSF